MSISISQSLSAVSPGITSSFLASSGTAPYVYSILSGGAGGTINSATGVYTAPVLPPSDPSKQYDTIQATDSLSATVTAQILVGRPLTLVWDIIKTYMGLDDNHVYLWDQKIFQPTDSNPYIAISELSCRPFANTNSPDTSGSGLVSVQSINMYVLMSIDIMSRGPAARDRKEEVLLALNSQYSQQQQFANSFYIGKLPAGNQFVNLSNQDGAAIPYRFNISIGMQYFYVKPVDDAYMDTFSPVDITTEP